jgi:hypothetical protein
MIKKVKTTQKSQQSCQNRQKAVSLQEEMVQKFSHRRYVLLLMVLAIAVVSVIWLMRSQPKDEPRQPVVQHSYLKIKDFDEKRYPTPNYDRTRKNKVRGIVLHHTGEPTVEESLEILSSPERKVSTHVVIDTDGTRYVMADPTVVTYHAGHSILHGMEHCNYCTIGIEFQGNTLEKPLTGEQIASAIEYVLPIIEEYNIPLDNIVTHEMVRNAYRAQYPDKRCDVKVDITPAEHAHFMQVLRTYYIIKERVRQEL